MKFPVNVRIRTDAAAALPYAERAVSTTGEDHIMKYPVLLAMVAALSLSACQKKLDDQPPKPEVATPAPTPAPDMKSEPPVQPPDSATGKPAETPPPPAATQPARQ